jgi:hypothetical protein
MKLSRLWPIVALVVLLPLSMSVLSASARPDTFSNYVPVYVPHQGETYDAGGSSPIIALTYVKQSNQVDFRACAQLIGDGTWMLSYPGAGDPINFSYASYTWACIDTPTGTGGGTMGFPLQLWLQQGAGATVHIATPNIFVSTVGTSAPVNLKP